MALRPEQRLALLGAKLRALVAEGWPEQGVSVARPFMGGAGLVSEDGHTGWVLVDDVQRRVENIDIAADNDGPELPRGWLGGAIVWATRAQVSQLHVLSERFNGDDARRAELFSLPTLIWLVRGRTLTRVAPVEYIPPEPPDAVSMLFAPAIEQAGADAVIDHGVLYAEVLGLEVATVTLGEGEVPYLAVGVGRHDRLAQAMMYGSADAAESLRTAVAAVKNFRRGDAGIHPANQLAPERWLRHIVAASDPALEPVEGTEPPRLKRSSPSLLVASDFSRVVGCTTAVDLDAIAFAADARAHFAPDARLEIVMPASSRVPAMELLSAALKQPASIRTVSDDWRNSDTTAIAGGGC